MGVISSLLLPLIIYLLICLNGIGKALTATMTRGQDVGYHRIIEAQQREREVWMLESARGSRAYSAEVEQMRYNRMTERQMRRVRSRNRGNWP